MPPTRSTSIGEFHPSLAWRLAAAVSHGGGGSLPRPSLHPEGFLNKLYFPCPRSRTTVGFAGFAYELCPGRSKDLRRSRFLQSAAFRVTGIRPPHAPELYR